ncbi:cation channel family protein [Stylonychia lemnae]|uniref:Cation channel family protein n=1 Tax=Stylonychia lemnae TaxID=5949 RepID=A0A077ZRG1_STYLE|nr:cation channel family protein [Stylonychia lemnae]|eukprot:CDW71925.1 cation channel family protein [Stylonychia lemnae]
MEQQLKGSQDTPIRQHNFGILDNSFAHQDKSGRRKVTLSNRYLSNQTNPRNVSRPQTAQQSNMTKVNPEDLQIQIAKRSKLIYGVEDYMAFKRKLKMKDQMKKTYDGRSSMHNSYLIEEDKQNKFIIPLTSTWKKYFNLWMVLLVGYSCFSTAFYVAFGYPSNQLGVLVVDYFVLAFFIIDIILDSQEIVSDQKKIALKYVKSYLVIDLIATFPYELVTNNYYTTLFRLFRLFRIHEVLALLDFQKIRPFIEFFFQEDSRKRRIVVTFFLMNIFQIFSLVLTTITILYFLGCIWYIISDTLNTDYNINNDISYVETFGQDQYTNDYERFITSSYFIITTLAVIGYGDLYPKTNIEKIFDILIMILGVAFFSYIMGKFINIVHAFDDLTEEKDQSAQQSMSSNIDVHQWLNLLNRFTKKKTIKRTLQIEIDDHFKHYWQNDRLAQITSNTEFLKALPRVVKKNIMVQFLYDDVFYKFKNFFKTRKNLESKFLYDISFNLKPRQFFPESHRCIIYDEEDEVPEMYFIQKGQIGVGFYMFSKNPTDQSYRIGLLINEGSFICDYYVCQNKKSQFVYAAQKEVHAFSLSKRYLQTYIFDKYPDIAVEIKEDSLHNYKENIMNKMIKLRQEHLEEVNKISTYKMINVQQREDFNHDDLESSLTLSDKSKNDINFMLQRRIMVIQDEMQRLNKNLKDFVQSIDVEYAKFLNNIQTLHQAQTRLRSYSFKNPVHQNSTINNSKWASSINADLRQNKKHA